MSIRIKNTSVGVNISLDGRDIKREEGEKMAFNKLHDLFFFCQKDGLLLYVAHGDSLSESTACCKQKRKIVIYDDRLLSAYPKK